MKIFSRKITDEELIKRTRSLYNKRYYLGFTGLIISIVIFSCTYYFINKFDKEMTVAIEKIQLAGKQSNKEYYKNLGRMQYFLGVKMGYHFAGGVYIAIGLFVLSVTTVLAQRKNKLLLELYASSLKEESGENFRAIKDIQPAPEKTALKNTPSEND